MGPLPRLLQRARALLRGSTTTAAGLRSGAGSPRRSERWMERTRTLWRGRSTSSTSMDAAERPPPKDLHPPPKNRRGSRSIRPTPSPPRAGLMERVKKMWRGPKPPSSGSREFMRGRGSKTRGSSTAESLKSIDRRLQNLEEQNMIKWVGDLAVSVVIGNAEKLKEYFDKLRESEKLKECLDKLKENLDMYSCDAEKLDESFPAIVDPW